ncbi:MAG: hypothetical protein KAR80_08500 [Rhodospirillaceae bacterium]|nr:hypothetical protein [Rhodospirillaceae bacterium]
MSETEIPYNDMVGACEAINVKPGNIVILETSDGPAAFIKTERIGKEYIHHYAVQIFPRVLDNLGMVYLDPEDKVFDTVLEASFELGSGINDAPPNSGHVFENAKGRFIKVDDDPKSQKMFGFIELTTGIVKRRQERGITAVYTEWCAVCFDNGKNLSLDDLLNKFKNET